MRLKISHRTEYRYDAPVQYLLQRLRLLPLSGPTQTVASWAIKIDGAREEVADISWLGGGEQAAAVEVNVFYEDRAGDLWLGTRGAGLLRCGCSPRKRSLPSPVSASANWPHRSARGPISIGYTG